VLISGGNGFLGKILLDILESKGDSVNTVGRSELNDTICDLAKDVPLFRTAYEVVIHTAGKAHYVPTTDSEAQEFFDVNFRGTQNLCLGLEKMEKLPRAFVFISTVAVYGVDEGQLISETAPLNGKTPYALSKIAAENYLQEWASTHGVVLGILRLPLVVGKNPTGNLGAMVRGIRTGKYLSIGLANAKKSMIWAEDLARLVERLAEVGGVYNLTDGYHPSFGELESVVSTFYGRRIIKIPYFVAKGLAIVGDVLGAKFPINSEKLKKISSTLTYDDSRAKTRLGWNPSKVIDQIHKIL
jgi:GlcNAc-P-P-Und epimerase